MNSNFLTGEPIYTNKVLLKIGVNSAINEIDLENLSLRSNFNGKKIVDGSFVDPVYTQIAE